MTIIANISNRHIHLTQEDLYKLFGENYELTKVKNLMQPKEFASGEFVSIRGPKRKIERVRIIGPLREYTQVEISRTDAFTLGICPPVRDSGDLSGSSPITIIGPKGKIDLGEGCIIAQRHIHMTPQDAQKFQVKDKEMIRIKTRGAGKSIFENTLIKVNENYVLECHLDTDEANACGLKSGDLVKII